MSVKFNRKMFDKAENIAHGYFWLSDSTQVRERVEKHVTSSPSFNKGDIGNYVALICMISMNLEKELY